MITVMVAVDPQTGRRVAVADGAVRLMSKLDALGRDWREVDYVNVPLSESLQERRQRLTLRPPAGYRPRHYPSVSVATARRRLPVAAQRFLRRVRDAGGADAWVAMNAMPYGVDTIPLAARGLLLIAEPVKGRAPKLYRLAP